MDQTAIGLAVRGIDERTPGDTTEQALQPELDDAHALLGRVDELAAVSQHLAALRARHLVSARKDGTLAYYTLRSRLVAELLRVARELLGHRLSESQSMLRALRREKHR